MIFKKLYMKNIRSYQSIEIEFPRGSVLLSGDIGAGKTSILLGLQFALFGLQPGQKGSSILRNGEDNAVAILEIEIDGKNILLERGLKKGKNGAISQDLNVISIDGKREEISTSEMKSRVIELLRYPREFIKKSNLLYRFTVYTPQEEMKDIIQERPEIRLDTLRHIFGIDRYKRIKDNVQIFLQRVKDKINVKEVLVSELNLVKEKLNELKERKIQLAREVKNLEVEYGQLLDERIQKNDSLKICEDKLKERNFLKSEIVKMGAILSEKKIMLDRVQREVENMKKQIAQKVEFSEDKLRAVEDLYNKHKITLDEMNAKYLAINSRISVLKSKIEEARVMGEKVAGLDNCPTCFQVVSIDYKEKISKKATAEITEMNYDLEHKLQERAQLVKDIAREKDLISDYESDRAKMQQNRIKFAHQREIEIKIKSDIFVVERLANEIIKVEGDIKNLKEKLVEGEKDERNYLLQKQEFDLFLQKFREKEILLAEKNKELELRKGRLDELNEEVVRKEKIKEELIMLKGLQDWLQEKFVKMIDMTEKNVLTKLRMEFSQLFAEWFSMLVEDGLSVRLDEDFTPVIINQDYEIDYDFLSGGERTAVALAYRLALNQILNSMLSKIKTKDIVILDEPTDGFSEEQILKMRDIFEQLNAEQMILVSHEKMIESFVDNVIRVSKDKVSYAQKVEA